MKSKKSKPRKNRRPTRRALTAMRLMSEDVRLSTGEAMRRAGYSLSSSLKPQRLTKGTAFQELLHSKGLTDELLSDKYIQLLHSNRLESKTFPSVRVSKRKWVECSDEQIKRTIEKTVGAQLVSIRDSIEGKVAYYTVPEVGIQKGMADLITKVKGHFAADKLDIGIDHTMTDKEAALLSSILKNNKNGSRSK